MFIRFDISPAGECGVARVTERHAAEGATGPRKRSGTRNRDGRKNLWKAGPGNGAAPTE